MKTLGDAPHEVTDPNLYERSLDLDLFGDDLKPWA